MSGLLIIGFPILLNSQRAKSFLERITDDDFRLIIIFSVFSKSYFNFLIFHIFFILGVVCFKIVVFLQP